MLKSGLFAVLLMVSGSVFAGCGDSKIYLYHLQNNQIVSQGYGESAECANMYSHSMNWSYQSKGKQYLATRGGAMEEEPGYWVNNKKADFRNKIIRGKKMECFIFGKQELLCAKADW
ncbi:hypothetical protein ACOR62_05045 [Neisseria lisongii]|uniref:Lipoprotein n=1 Tax=Neisseria lisongii TaxID=2912188 RepID=A0AAW5AJZ2_9NEIS|nr:hypothetical protein [Neisseria lisongii]MCF7528786.1 hypothetical protein [Neisseria lisongii]MCF7529644.1 hypothetical protein [Neisseria lisongii]